MQIQIEHKSIIGSREDQQDAYHVSSSQNTAFAVVCDGMGGTMGGSAASKIVVHKLKELIKTKDPTEQFPVFFFRAIDILDESVIKLNKISGANGSGTTVVAAAIEKGCLYWLSVGDSRLYIIRGNEIVQATRDHNIALALDQWTSDELEKSGMLPENHRSDALTSFIGMGGVRIYDISDKPFHLSPGDIILLTTDGLTKILDNDEIMSLLLANQYPKRLETLFERAGEKLRGAQDNTTCVLIHIEEGGGIRYD